MRPAVTVICPFAGSDAELARTRAALAAIALRDGDELVIADNRPGAPAGAVASSYHARGVAAATARGAWLVFVDADTEPEPGLLEAYFDPPPAERTGVLAGGIVDWVDTDTRVARYIARRRKLDQAVTLAHPRRAYAQTANCAVRRSAFEAVGGWPEPVRSGGDADLCWRLQAAGWGIEERPAARVRHRNRTTLRALLGQLHRHGSGMAWLERRWPGAFPPPTARELAGRVRLLRDADGVIDFLALWARDLGRLRGNG